MEFGTLPKSFDETLVRETTTGYLTRAWHLILPPLISRLLPSLRAAENESWYFFLILFYFLLGKLPLRKEQICTTFFLYPGAFDHKEEQQREANRYKKHEDLYMVSKKR